MPDTSKSDHFSIMACVSRDAITKVTRLFNASLDDILAELLQNARRAGASRIEIDQFEHDRMGRVIRIKDNGPGVADARSLFTLGRSNWAQDTQAREDAAGMGFFSLAGRTVEVTAQITGTNASRVFEAGPDGFSGKASITGRDGPEGHKGLSVLIAAKPNENVVPVANAAAKFCPVQIIVEGVEAERKNFLEKAVLLERWKGIRIGIFREASSIPLRDHTANFHGLTLRVPLPHLSQQYHSGYYARIDVESCAELKLVLPARKEVVRDDFYTALCQKIRAIYFGLIADQGTHSLSFRDFAQARDLGFELPDAVSRLRPFSPMNADRDSNEMKPLEAVWSEAFIFAGGEAAVEEQNLAWALSLDDNQVRLYDPNSAFKGYAWYDAINTVEITGYVRDVGERRLASNIGDAPAILDRPDRLFVVGHVHSNGDLVDWQVETDLLLLAPPDAQIDETVLCLTKPACVSVADLVDFMTRALFCPSDDFDAGSYDNQLQGFTDEAEDAAIEYLQGVEDVQLSQVIRTFRRELWWIVKPDADVRVHVRGCKVEVCGLETVFKPQSA